MSKSSNGNPIVRPTTPPHSDFGLRNDGDGGDTSDVTRSVVVELVEIVFDVLKKLSKGNTMMLHTDSFPIMVTSALGEHIGRVSDRDTALVAGSGVMQGIIIRLSSDPLMCKVKVFK